MFIWFYCRFLLSTLLVVLASFTEIAAAVSHNSYFHNPKRLTTANRILSGNKGNSLTFALLFKKKQQRISV